MIHVDPGFQYLLDIFTKGALKSTMDVFKACRSFNPLNVQEMKPDASSIDELSIMPFLSADLISNLKIELPCYLAKATDLFAEIDVLEWWKNHALELPNWALATSLAVLIQPTCSLYLQTHLVIDRI